MVWYVCDVSLSPFFLLLLLSSASLHCLASASLHCLLFGTFCLPSQPHPTPLSLPPSFSPFFLLLHIPSIQCKQSLAAVQNARLDTSCGVLEEGGTTRGGGEGESEGGAGAGAGGGEEECEEETKRNGKGLFGGRKR